MIFIDEILSLVQEYNIIMECLHCYIRHYEYLKVWFIRESVLFDRLAFLICNESILGIRLPASLLVTALEAVFTKLSSKFSLKLELLVQFLMLYSDYQDIICELLNLMSPRET